jgi:hypothetical protein
MKIESIVSIIRGTKNKIKVVDYSTGIIYFDSTIEDFFDKDIPIVLGDSEVAAIDYKDGKYVIEIINKGIWI